MIELNCKVIKEWQPPLPPFSGLSHFLAKNFVPPPPQVTQYSEGHTSPPLIREGESSDYDSQMVLSLLGLYEILLVF